MDYTISIYKDQNEKPVAKEHLDFDFYWNEKRRNDFNDTLTAHLSNGEEVTVKFSYPDKKEVHAQHPMIRDAVIDVKMARYIAITTDLTEDKRANRIIKLNKHVNAFIQRAESHAHEVKMRELGCTPTY